METKSFWDIKIRIKNFSAKTAMDSSDFRMISYSDGITFRRGKFNREEISIENISKYMFYEIKYIDLLPINNESEQVNMMEWISLNKNLQYSILFKNFNDRVLEGTIRFYNLDDAFKFRLQFNDYIIFDKQDTKIIQN